MTAEYKLHLAVFCVVCFKDRGKSLSLLTVISNLIVFVQSNQKDYKTWANFHINDNIKKFFLLLK